MTTDTKAIIGTIIGATALLIMTTRLQNYTKTFADRLLAAIEAGTAPWQQPWRPGELALPRNLTTARKTRGTTRCS